MTVEKMLSEMSSQELTYWKAWSALEAEDYETEKNKALNKKQVTGNRRR